MGSLEAENPTITYNDVYNEASYQLRNDADMI